MIVDELENFRSKLLVYYGYRKRQIENQEIIEGKELDDFTAIYKEIGVNAGKYAPLIEEFTGLETIHTSAGPQDIWNWAFSFQANSLVLSALDNCIQATGRVIGKLEGDIQKGKRDPNTGEKIAVISTKLDASVRPKAFIAHGGQSPILDKLKEFLIALGIEPLVVEEQASENRSVGDNVDYYARQADFAIILATKGDIDGQTGGFIPRGNVLIEIGKSQEIFKDRIIYLLQAGTKFPTNISEKVRGRFTTERMDDAFIKIARELTEMKILKAVKPPKE